MRFSLQSWPQPVSQLLFQPPLVMANETMLWKSLEASQLTEAKCISTDPHFNSLQTVTVYIYGFTYKSAQR